MDAGDPRFGVAVRIAAAKAALKLAEEHLETNLVSASAAMLRKTQVELTYAMEGMVIIQSRKVNSSKT